MFLGPSIFTAADSSIRMVPIMLSNFQFDSDVLQTMAGGRSAIDIQHLNITSIEAADAFVKNYGFNTDDPQVVEKIWYYHRRALVLLTERLGFKMDEIPALLTDRKELEDIRKLLVFASDRNIDNHILQRWSCALLRCMHVFVHSENDLFSSFSQEIQSQILSPFQKAIVNDGVTHTPWLRGASDPEGVELVGFEVKPFKTSSSTVIKLLAKPDALAMMVFDKVGVRFITKSLFDSFQVLRFLSQENVISFPHIMPDQSSNNLYPVDAFLDVCKKLEGRTDVSKHEIISIFEEHLQSEGSGYKVLRKENSFSGQDHRFIKFINRKLVRIESPGKEPFSFFFPYEVQIMDQEAHSKIMSGPSEHDAYKDRQKMAARKRILPDLE